jgi:transposase
MDLRTDFDAEKVRIAAGSADHRRAHRLEAIARLYELASVERVAKELRVEPLTIRRWSETFNEGGVDALLAADLRTGSTFHLRTDFDAKSVRELADRAPTIGGRARFIAIAMMYDGVTIVEIARQLKVSEVRLYGWRDEFNRDVRLAPYQDTPEAPRLEARNRYWPTARVDELVKLHPDRVARLRPIMESQKGGSIETIAKASGHTRAQIASWIRIFNASGARALIDAPVKQKPSHPTIRSHARPKEEKAPPSRQKPAEAPVDTAPNGKKINLPYDADALREAAKTAVTRGRQRQLLAIAEAMHAGDAEKALSALGLTWGFVGTILTEIRRDGLASFARRELSDDVTADDILALVPDLRKRGLPHVARELELIAMVYSGATAPEVAAQANVNEHGLGAALTRLKHLGLSGYVYKRAEQTAKRVWGDRDGHAALLVADDASSSVKEETGPKGAEKASEESDVTPLDERVEIGRLVAEKQAHNPTLPVSTVHDTLDVDQDAEASKTTMLAWLERGPSAETPVRMTKKAIGKRLEGRTFADVDEPFAWLLDRAVPRTSKPMKRMISWAEITGRGGDLLRRDDDEAEIGNIEVEMSVGTIRRILRVPLDPGLMSRMEAIQKVKSGTSLGKVARRAGIHASDLALWVTALNRQGPAVLMDDMSVLARYKPRLTAGQFERLKVREPRLAQAVKSLISGSYPPLIAQGLHWDLETMMRRIESYKNVRNSSFKQGRSTRRTSANHTTGETTNRNAVASWIAGEDNGPKNVHARNDGHARRTENREGVATVGVDFDALPPRPFQRFAIDAVQAVRAGMEPLLEASESRGIPMEMMCRWLDVSDSDGLVGLLMATQPEDLRLPRHLSPDGLRKVMMEMDGEARREIAAVALLYDGARLGDAAEITGVDIGHLFNLVEQMAEVGMAAFEQPQEWQMAHM